MRALHVVYAIIIRDIIRMAITVAQMQIDRYEIRHRDVEILAELPIRDITANAILMVNRDLQFAAPDKDKFILKYGMPQNMWFEQFHMRRGTHYFLNYVIKTSFYDTLLKNDINIQRYAARNPDSIHGWSIMPMPYNGKNLLLVAERLNGHEPFVLQILAINPVSEEDRKYAVQTMKRIEELLPHHLNSKISKQLQTRLGSIPNVLHSDIYNMLGSNAASLRRQNWRTAYAAAKKSKAAYNEAAAASAANSEETENTGFFSRLFGTRKSMKAFGANRSAKAATLRNRRNALNAARRKLAANSRSVQLLE